VLDGDPAPSPKRGVAPQKKFSAHVYCGHRAGCIKMALGMEVGLSPGDFVLDGDPASPPLKGHSPPNFRPMSVVAKRLDGLRWHLAWRYASAQATLCSMGTQLPPVFGPCLLWPNGWMDEDATLYGSRPRPRPHCIRRGPSSARNGHRAPPHPFGSCLLWPRSPIATVELLC